MSFLARSTPSHLFPNYLLPSIPFRRRRSSTSTTSSSSSPTSSSPASSTSPPYLSGHTSYLRCARCATDLCLTSQIISKGFTGRHGRAYLVSPVPVPPTTTRHLTHKNKTNQNNSSSSNRGEKNLPNTHIHKPVPRQLVTGAHMVCDVSCVFCGSVLGWKYDAAEEEGQRYKIGKFILETKKVVESCCWERGGRGGSGGGIWDAEWEEDEQDDEVAAVVRDSREAAAGEEEEEEDPVVEFDSQDEDECEDLFAGVWSPALALRRRQSKRFAAAARNGRK